MSPTWLYLSVYVVAAFILRPITICWTVSVFARSAFTITFTVLHNAVDFYGSNAQRLLLCNYNQRLNLPFSPTFSDHYQDSTVSAISVNDGIHGNPSISKNTQIVVYINLLVSVTVALKIVALFTFAIILSGSASLSLGCQSRWLIISILFMFFYLISTIPLCNEGNFQLPNLLLAYLFFLKNSAQN